VRWPLSAFFASGHVVDALLLLMAAEAAAVAWIWRRRGRPVAPYLRTLAAGVFLLLALRVALTGGDWPWIALALAAGGIAHAADLRGRWTAVP